MPMPLPSSLQQSLETTKVDYIQLGSSGLRVSVPILGAMSFGSKKWSSFVLEEAEGIELLKAAYDSGINTWDTANMYSNGISEEIIGKAIRQHNIPREKLVIMTKVMQHVGEEPGIHGPALRDVMNRSKDYVNLGGLSRAAIFKAVDACLRRLGITYIDVLQIHRFDPSVPMEETMKALHDLIQAGKVHYLGASSMWASQFARMQFTAEKNGWTKFVSMQLYYHLCYREEERDMLQFCRETGVGIMAYSPLFSGRLARPVGSGTSARSKMPSPLDPKETKTDEEIIGRVEELAKKRGWLMTEVALAWLTGKGVVPAVGVNSEKRLDDACGIRGKNLTADEVQYLEEPYLPKPVVSHV